VVTIEQIENNTMNNFFISNRFCWPSFFGY